MMWETLQHQIAAMQPRVLRMMVLGPKGALSEQILSKQHQASYLSKENQQVIRCLPRDWRCNYLAEATRRQAIKRLHRQNIT